MEPMTDLLYGHRVKGTPPADVPDAMVSIGGTHGKKQTRIGISKTMLSKNMLFIGGTGSGKTNTIHLLLRELRQQMTEEDVMIIFDTKGDFERIFFDESKGDIVLGNSPAYRQRSKVWNIYQDVLADGWRDETMSINIGEIARALFEANKSASQPFFANAARGVFSAQMLAMLRSAKLDSKLRETKLNNKALLEFFRSAAMEQYTLLSKSWPDLRSIQMYLGDGKTAQALGVLAEIQVMMQDTFLGVFGAVGDFSIRKFIRDKGGKTLFLEYDLSIGETLSPLYSLLMDLALKEALGRSEEEGKKGNVYIIFDELKLLPTISHLDDAVNFGRGMGVKLMAGLQSIVQIHDNYGEEKGDAILAGFSSYFAFRPNDAKTRTFVQEHFGKNLVSEIYDADGGAVSERRLGSTVEDWDLSNLCTGEAVVGLDCYPPFRFRFDKFD